MNRWNERNNARLQETAEHGRFCNLEGCGKPLPPHRLKYCNDAHANNARKRKWQRAQLDKRLFGPDSDVTADAMLFAVDVESITQIVDEVAGRIKADDEAVAYYRGVETTRIIKECLLDDEMRHRPYALPKSLRA